ncbi:MAG: polysaccharide deacetylase family protein [Planctomycetota bacterium]
MSDSLRMTIIYNILFVYFIVLCLYLGLPYLARILLKKKFLSDIGKDEQVCLTFDDGPNPESTPDILTLLDDLGVKATFFLIGENIKKHPELYHKIINQGHEIGDHGYRHVNACACLPFCAVIDLIRGSSIIRKNGNARKVFWLRLPYGKLNLLTLCYVLLCRRKLAFWNIDPRDYLSQPPEQISALVLNKLTRGSVILLHERSFYTNKNMEGNISAIKVIVQEIKKRGYRFAVLSEAMPTRN